MMDVSKSRDILSTTLESDDSLNDESLTNETSQTNVHVDIRLEWNRFNFEHTTAESLDASCQQLPSFKNFCIVYDGDLDKTPEYIRARKDDIDIFLQSIA